MLGWFESNLVASFCLASMICWKDHQFAIGTFADGFCYHTIILVQCHVDDLSIIRSAVV